MWLGPAPRIVIGITNAQTCLVLSGRIRALQDAAFHVTVVSSPGDLLDRMERDEGIDTLRVPMQRGIAPVADLLSLYRLWRGLLKLKPDVVEFSTPKAGLLGMIAAFLAGIPHRVYFLRGLKLESLHGIRRLVLLLTERTATACAHVVLCNSASLRKKALAIGLASDEKLHILGPGSSNGIDTVRFRPGASDVRKQFGIPDGARVLGFVGRLTRDKGIPELIDAFERILPVIPHAYLLLVGWFDEAEDALEREFRCRILANPHIVCTGFVLDAAPCYRGMDLLVLPSMREGFPNVVLEASASGIPVISTLSTGARDSVVHGKTGLLVRFADRDALFDAIMRLLGDANERQQMGAAGRSWVLEHFLDRHIRRLTGAFYRDLVKAEGRRVPIERVVMDWAAPSR
jgi:glycosyltransferase involved in cell wall biosynthesis